MKKFYESLREPAIQIINFKKKKMKLLKKEKEEWYENAKICYNCKEKIPKKCLKGNYTGERISAAHSICNLKHTVRKNPTAFHNGSNCDYHFIIKQFALTSQGLE